MADKGHAQHRNRDGVLFDTAYENWISLFAILLIMALGVCWRVAILDLCNKFSFEGAFIREGFAEERAFNISNTAGCPGGKGFGVIATPLDLTQLLNWFKKLKEILA